MLRSLPQWAVRLVILGAALGLVAAPANAQQGRTVPLNNAQLPYGPPSTNCCPTPYSYGPGGMVNPGDTAPNTQGSTADGTGMGNAAAPSFPSPSSGADVGTSVAFAPAGGYLDSAIPMTQFRLRYDAGYGMNRPDRDEYFYGAWNDLSFHPHAIVNNGVAQGYFFDRNARGPTQSGNSVNYQEASAYFEYAFNKRFSGFVDLPFRAVNFNGPFEGGDETGPTGNPDGDNPKFPEKGENPYPNNNPFGVSDFQFGFKYAFIANPDQFLTFQFRTYVPTGNASQGLGTGHVSLEPSLLYYKQLSERFFFQAQLTDWIPVDGTAEAGNLVSYGIGLSYLLYQSPKLRIVPVAEFMGYTALSGYESFFSLDAPFNPNGLTVQTDHGVTRAAGDTIIDGKFGVRTYFEYGTDFYVGYGQALTSDRWYRDMVRAELRFRF